MNISYNWLKKYINLELPAEKVSETLTSIGLEVDSVEEVEGIRGGLKGLVVGHVLSCEMHPNSDHLHVCQVDLGTGEPQQIVCGAANVAAGQKVIVATIGTVLYDGDQTFTIKPSKLRGVPSNGMICAEDEIGVGNDHSGIIELPADTPVGLAAKDYYGLESDTVIVVDITPNRADAASHWGVARDLYAALSLKDSNLKLTKPSVDNFKVDDHSFEIKVTVENADSCPRYSGVAINNVTIKESPDWLKKALQSIGLTPINNIVDVTNYVLFALGQPLHAFDGDKIKDGEIRVGGVAAGTKFVTLDGKERTLHQDDVLIKNANNEPMCLAGVFGGLDSGVSDSTKRIFLESAWFNPVCIRKTARRQQLSTDASFRYERGTDPNNTVYALKYAAMLIKEVAGGTISSEIVDLYPNPKQHFEVTFNKRRATSLIGKEIPEETVKKILTNLEIEIVADNGEELSLRVPPYRVDVTREADVVEDILRIYGYNNVEVPEEVKSTIVYEQKPNRTKLLNTIASQLNAAGYQEIMCNTLTKGSYYDNLQTYKRENCVELLNPLSSDLNVLRQTLIFSALEVAQHNRNHKNSDLKIFEIGNCQSFKTGDKSDLNNYTETLRLSILITGLRAEANWNTPAQPVTFFDLKTTVNNLIARLGVNASNIEELPLSNELFSEGLTLQMDKSKTLAEYGLVDSKLLKQFDIDVPVYYAEINLPLLFDKSAKQNKVLYAELPKFPEVKRDLALLIDKSVSFAQIKALAFKVEKKILKRVSLFDVYEGKNLAAGKKSYAVSFYLQDETKTLQDKQIEKIMEQLIATFKKELGAELR
ncbi:MAG: phenylalanine--tRNA ligase subunit beta [Bacteroidales bacterium]|nr:phenylalanine--tRNA ligase subunit beta [Bacteroidales bacterium]